MRDTRDKSVSEEVVLNCRRRRDEIRCVGTSGDDDVWEARRIKGGRERER